MTAVAADVLRSSDTTARAPLHVLLEDATPPGPDVRGRGMPAELARRYGGELLVPLPADRPAIIANFVSSLDGIVALGRDELSGGGLISGFHEPDRFVMGLLRYAVDIDAGEAAEPEDIIWGDRLLQGIAVTWLVLLSLGVVNG